MLRRPKLVVSEAARLEMERQQLLRAPAVNECIGEALLPCSAHVSSGTALAAMVLLRVN